jgi:hypothetical protein
MHAAVKSAFADCDIVLRIVEVQKTAGGFVDHALVPLKHESEPILEDPGTPRFVISSVPISVAEHRCAFKLQNGYPATSRTRGRGNKAALDIAQFCQLSNDTSGCIFRRVSVPV